MHRDLPGRHTVNHIPQQFQQELNDVTYGNGMFVAVGNSGAIMTSPDAGIWTAATSPTDRIIYSIIYVNGTFVAVGGGAGAPNRTASGIFVSSDGLNWQVRDPGLDMAYRGITYGIAYGSASNTLIIVGEYGLIAGSGRGGPQRRRQP